tara:strand:- start:8272 stop:9339 length:1068 start_codon:yes stop_codon:yes gene_type:complete
MASPKPFKKAKRPFLSRKQCKSMKFTLPAALNNHLCDSADGPMSIEKITKVFKTAFPGFQSIESNLRRSHSIWGDNLTGIKFPDMGIVFGTHNPYRIFTDDSYVPNLILPISGFGEITEGDGNKVRHSAADCTGSYFTGNQLAYAQTDSVKAIALGFNPDKLLEVLRSVAGNPGISLPEHSFEINFSRARSRFLLERFFYSLNAVGTLGAFNEVTQDMIMRHCAYLILETQGYNLSTKVLAHKSNVIDHVCAYMFENLSEPLTLTGLEAVAGISVRSLQIEFKKRFQLSPLCWLKEQRLLRAHQLLTSRSEDRPVSMIAKECGFTHFGRFSVSFKKKFGVSASTLKKSSPHLSLE